MAEAFRKRLPGYRTNLEPVQIRAGEFVRPCRPETITTSLTLLPVNRFKHGYAELATFQSSDEAFAICRRYNYLQARLILERQDDLRVLEQRLDRYDEDDDHSHTKYNRAPGGQLVRDELLEKIETAFLSYCVPSLRVFRNMKADLPYSKHPQYCTTAE
jgi:hypothetical protein